ncbi:ESF1 homolog isoform X2 [Mya arenaria]|uniref:ESF1 homolog isoform X2 n=1 Tax=Mya arenaria TaxID=6604 RepID=UPI0022E6E787|nr:ESF1 homolog isoform X2 [Mya arenaria]
MDEVLGDKRFAHVAKDPRFRKVPLKERKVKIDQRFKHMFKDKTFKMKYSVDKRGRPVNLTTNENLKKYYELSDDSTSEEGEDWEDEAAEKAKKESRQRDEKKKKDEKRKGKEKQVKKRGEKKVQVVNDSESSSDSDDGGVNDSGIDFARGVGNVDSSSGSSDNSSNEDEEEEEKEADLDHRWGERDENVEDVDVATQRLAVCNMDWDRIKACDIYVLLNSFAPQTGIIKSVKIYPSEFGKERMSEEERQGPRELTEVKLDEHEGDEADADAEDEEGTGYHMEKLREYQLKRLRYFYAVVECDSMNTSDHIYKECDKMEYETSSTKLDLRFIPDDMVFAEDEVTSSCMDAPAGYKPQFFLNTALSQSKVDLTWDETDRDRIAMTIKQFSGTGEEIPDDDLQAYLASSSDEDAAEYESSIVEGSESNSEDEGEEKLINKYRALLQGPENRPGDKSQEDVQMEITWEPGLKETTESLVKKKVKAKDSTVWGEYLDQRKDKKKNKMEERKRKKQGEEEEASKSGDDDSADGEEKQKEEGGAAFSDDELPGGAGLNYPFFSKLREEKEKTCKKDKKKKKALNRKADDSKEKAELSLLMLNEVEERKKHFNYVDMIEENAERNVKRRGKKKKRDKAQKASSKQVDGEFQVNVNDPRFNAMYQSHLFNLDPSAPEFRKTKGTDAIITEKLKRSENQLKKKKHFDQTGNNEPAMKKRKKEEKKSYNDHSLANLVKSVKAKTKHFQNNKTSR